MSDQGSNNQPPSGPEWPINPPQPPAAGPPPQGPPPGWGQPPQGPPPGWVPPGGYGGYGPRDAGVSTTPYLVLSILEALICCLPLGVAAVVFSAMAISKNGNGDFQGATNDVKIAKILLIIGACVGVLLVGGFVLLGIIGALSDSSSSS